MHKIEFIEKPESSTIVIGVFEGEAVNLPIKLDFKGKLEMLDVAHVFENNKQTKYVLLGLGSKDKFDNAQAKIAGATLAANIDKIAENKVSVNLDINPESLACFIFGFNLRHWSFDKYITKKDDKKKLEILEIVTNALTEVKASYERYRMVEEGVFLARELTAEPSNVIYPESLANRCLNLQALGVDVEILATEDLEKLGMNLILGVAKGSDKPPFVVVMKWNGAAGKEQRLSLVGKGVCFDAGGISIKPALNMHEMRYDMASAATAIGVMHCVAKQKLAINISAIVGLVENMPDGKAQKPGDVVVSMSGQTVEVLDTDAEGRLVLADLLWYTQKNINPKEMIDMGTLTCETIGCLSNQYAGLFTDNNEILEGLTKAGKACGEEVWRLPLGEHFAKQLESSLADMTNIGKSGHGENAAAAEFLRKFTANKPWAHLDIAGVAWDSEDTRFYKKGVTGYGVRLLEEYVQGLIR